MIIIPTPSNPLENFFKKATTTFPERYLTINELKGAFFLLKMNKSDGADEISFRVIKNCLGKLSDIYLSDINPCI